jgi:hypothetical protein
LRSLKAHFETKKSHIKSEKQSADAMLNTSLTSQAYISGSRVETRHFQAMVEPTFDLYSPHQVHGGEEVVGGGGQDVAVQVDPFESKL